MLPALNRCKSTDINSITDRGGANNRFMHRRVSSEYAILTKRGGVAMGLGKLGGLAAAVKKNHL